MKLPSPRPRYTMDAHNFLPGNWAASHYEPPTYPRFRLASHPCHLPAYFPLFPPFSATSSSSRGLLALTSSSSSSSSSPREKVNVNAWLRSPSRSLHPFSVEVTPSRLFTKKRKKRNSISREDSDDFHRRRVLLRGILTFLLAPPGERIPPRARTTTEIVSFASRRGNMRERNTQTDDILIARHVE